MTIDIDQAKIALADKYRISIDGQEVYRAARKLWRIFAEVDLFYRDEGEPRLTIKKRLSFFKPSYDIFVGSNDFRFTTRSFWKHVYLCDIGNDHYEVYAHRGRKYARRRQTIAVFLRQHPEVLQVVVHVTDRRVEDHVAKQG